MRRILPFVSLFLSLGTLVCCAIPALLVALGLGATLAATISAFPQIVWLSEHKGFVFGAAGTLLTAAVLAQRSTQQVSCPTDAELGAACKSSRRAFGPLLGLSCLLYLTGAFFAFLAPLIW